MEAVTGGGSAAGVLPPGSTPAALGVAGAETAGGEVGLATVALGRGVRKAAGASGAASPWANTTWFAASRPQPRVRLTVDVRIARNFMRKL
jgi:hypothetical protein